MKNKVELPLITPMYSTYHSQGAGCAIIAENPSIQNWYLNEVMNLCCSRRFLSGYTTPEIGVHQSTWDENPYLEKIRIPLRFLNGYVHPIIREMIDNGYYVFFWGIDDYYLEGKSWYKSHHGEHDGLIYGYDQSKKTYLLHAYDINWMYNTFSISKKSFNQGRDAIFKEGSYGSLCGLKPTMESVTFSFQRVHDNLSEYLQSSFEKYPLDEDGSVYGIIVHDYIAMYIEKLMDESIPYHRMDRRIMRMIWEQKKVMLKRLQKFEDVLGEPSNISNAYACLADEANTIRMLYASHHMKRRDSVLPIIQKKLLNIKEQEKRLLTDVVEQLERVL